jgi:hypothetical protein
VVGSDGAIVATSDGGATWSAQASGSGADLFGVTFADATHGWAVGWDAFSSNPQHGVILATSDGGANWHTQVAGRDEWLYDVAFTDAVHGWAVGYNVVTSTSSILATTDGGGHWTLQKTGIKEALLGVSARRVFTPGLSTSSAHTGATLPALALTWENGIVTTVYDVQNPQEAATPIRVVAAAASLPSAYGVGTCRSLQVTASLVFFGGGELTIPASAVSSLGVPANQASKLVAFTRSSTGAVRELPGRYDPRTRKSTFTTESLSATFILATDTTKPVATALANAGARRGKTASLRYKVTDGRPVADTTITIFQGKKVKKTIKLGQRATGKNLVCAFKCTFSPGTYRWTVKATDRLGNSSSTARGSSKTLVVKP